MEKSLNKNLSSITTDELLGIALDDLPFIRSVKKICEAGYRHHLEEKVDMFLVNAISDENFVDSLEINQNLKNILFEALEAVRRTHSKIAVLTIALIFKAYHSKPDFLVPALRDFAELDDLTLKFFHKLYIEGACRAKQEGSAYKIFIYNPSLATEISVSEAVGYAMGNDLIRRNFFLPDFASSRLGGGLYFGVYEKSEIYFTHVNSALKILTDTSSGYSF